MDSIEEFELQNKTIAIYYDDCGESPREWDNLGVIAQGSKYLLGDHEMQNQDVFLMEAVGGILGEEWDNWYEWAIYNNLHEDIREKLLTEFYDKYIVQSVHLYDHSGICLNTSGFSCPWDSGQIGYIYVSKDKVRKEFGWKNITKQRIARIEGYLQNEIEILSLWAENRVYYFVATCNLCGKEDSCGGFYGENWKENDLIGQADYPCDCEL